ncbi:MAG: hypothetical protein L7H21_01295 [Sulfolobales archaeon]|nr:hypothetical protein [Sulfolobales archaeon]MCG2893224.1 hypothetical protein [Sulfolobales archaeon]MCG2910275.1 hypothetical protein [Sulfolobales archaeon]MCI4456170.1 hypothetical protein [Sulfolobus sp.]MCQ4344398.1 hypothetical protein [Sulfolobales archaeon]
MRAKARNNKKTPNRESISALKKELMALAFEPIYSSSFKDVVTRLTVMLQALASQYGYDVEFSGRVTKISDGDRYYFEYPVTLKRGSVSRKLKLGVQYLFYEEGKWVGMIVDVKP